MVARAFSRAFLWFYYGSLLWEQSSARGSMPHSCGTIMVLSSGGRFRGVRSRPWLLVLLLVLLVVLLWFSPLGAEFGPRLHAPQLGGTIMVLLLGVWFVYGGSDARQLVVVYV